MYLILRTAADAPRFLPRSTGGHFKGNDPSVDCAVLTDRWIDSALIIYIGTAGGDGLDATLKTRLRPYLRFGEGKRIGHWGGRYIWQLADAENLVVCWKATPDEEPIAVEHRLIDRFGASFHGALPFANCRR